MSESSVAGGALSRSAVDRSAPDWAAIGADPRFRDLRRRKSRFLGFLFAFSTLYYLLLPLGAAWLSEWFAIPVYGVVNLGILFALSQFLVAWGVAAVYTRRANREFDRLAADIRTDILKGCLTGRSR